MLLCSADTHVPAIEYRLLEYRYKVLHYMILVEYIIYINNYGTILQYGGVNIYAPSNGIPTTYRTKYRYQGMSIHDAPVPLFVRMDESRN